MSLFEDRWGSPRANKRRKRKEEGRIYFIQQGIAGPIKIGWSMNPRRRLETLQTANPVHLRLLGAVPGTEEREGELHKSLEGFRIQGEWFIPSDVVKNAVAIILGISVESLFDS